MNERRIGAVAMSLAVTVSSALAQPVEQVIVYGTQSGTEAGTGSRLKLTVMETPASIDVIDGEAARSRVDTHLLDAVTRSAGFTNEANPGNGHSSIAARGFRGQGTVTKLFDGTQYFTAAGTITFPFDTWGMERVEVLKGPSSVLYGEGGIGGAINVIPRRPQFEQSGDVRLMIGENNTTFVGIDYTDGIGDSLAYRVDYSKNQSDNWVNDGESDLEMFSFALLWNASDDLQLNLRYDLGDQSPMKYFGVPIANGDFAPGFEEKNFNVADAEIRYEDDALRLRADYRISDRLALQTEVYRLATDRFWKNAEYYIFDGSTQLLTRTDPLVIGHDMDHTGLRASFAISPVESSVSALVGFESNDISFVRPTNFGPANPDPLDFSNDVDVVDPFDFQPGTLLDLTDAPVLLDNLSDVRQFAIFGEARVNVSDRVALVGALRFDDFATDFERLGQTPIDQDADAVTGRIGAVFDLSDRTVLYGQYGTGATHPSNSVVTASAANREADLIESEQVEIGLKHLMGGTGLTWSVALFDVVKNDLVEDDPDSGDPSDLIVIPEQTSQGIEVGVSYSASAFQVYANLSVLNAETDAGIRPNFVPEETANVGFVWNDGGDLSFVADARHVGDRFHSAFPIPSYTVVDASIAWNASDDIRLTLKADNFFDEEYASSPYFSDTWIIGRPRTFSLIADYGF